MKKISMVLVGLMVLALALPAMGQGDDDNQAALSFIVLKSYSGKPIRNASVVLHPVDKHDRQESGGLELKADEQGKCYYDGIPYGVLRVQVLARGFQTFGKDYKIDQPKMTITIKLDRPQPQYSIYKDQENDKKGTPPANNNAAPKQ